MSTTTLPQQPHTTAPTSQPEARGFALYVGLSETELAGHARLGHLVSELRALVAELAPEAQTHATVALAPAHAGGRDLDVVRLALADPSLKRETEPHAGGADPDRAEPHVTIDLTRK